MNFQMRLKCLLDKYFAKPEYNFDLTPEVEGPVTELGSSGGKKFIYAEGLSSDSVVYSFGIGQDASFDLDVIAQFGLTVFGFDPTPETVAWVETQDMPENFRFYPYGLGVKNGTAKFYPKRGGEGFKNHSLMPGRAPDVPPIEVKIKNLQTIAKELGHTHIDILKIDIEGSEIEVLPPILKSGLDITQIQIEFHHGKFYEPCATQYCLDLLKKHGYQLCMIDGRDLSFIKTGDR